MNPLFLTHFTNVTALGRGNQAMFSALSERRSGLSPCDFQDTKLNTYIGRVAGIEDSPFSDELKHFDCRNNRLALLALQQDGFEEAIVRAREQYGAHRIGVILGTSTSGILETEHAYRQQRNSESSTLPDTFTSRYQYTHNTFSVAHFVRTQLQLQGLALVISTACSSSAKVFASASRYIEAGLCDAVVVGGVDSLCLTTLYGFASLELESPEPCRPSDINRNGLSIGEGAGFVLLERQNRDTTSPVVALIGYGESCDAHHMSHPHPSGAGAILAMQQGLASSSIQANDIDYVHLHGTATKANDKTEDHAVSSVLGNQIPCSSTKGWTGHTLGAAGAVEAVIDALCLHHRLIPGSLNAQTLDPCFSSNIVLNNQEKPISTILSNFFGFGGNNCSLVFRKI
ncbi:MAG: beta-ketoacyl-[acyl-carrier-protein] synthase II [Nitrospirales bacterium]|nr:MAG: beta-ketoacyl-[acyl-carrier-protein] synthase II [Nitrospirales bacterium]